MKTIKILKIIRDASSQPNHNIPYTKKCVYHNHFDLLPDEVPLDLHRLRQSDFRVISYLSLTM